MSKKRILEAMADCGTPKIVGDNFIYADYTNDGFMVDVITVPYDKVTGGLAVIHAMPRYREKK